MVMAGVFDFAEGAYLAQPIVTPPKNTGAGCGTRTHGEFLTLLPIYKIGAIATMRTRRKMEEDTGLAPERF